MSDPYIGEIRFVGFTFAPSGWGLCNGAILSIQQNTALFSIMGTMYGGNGVTTFALPNLSGRAPIHSGTAPGGPTVTQGQTFGSPTHTLTLAELPSHTHPVQASATTGTSALPANKVIATTPAPTFGAATGMVSLDPSMVLPTGGTQPHPNMQPYLVLNAIVALQGIFPSRG